MEGFDTMTMSYLASPLSLNSMQNNDYLNAMPPMDMQEQRSSYDVETFVRYVRRWPSGYRAKLTPRKIIVATISGSRSTACPRAP
jgi:hypothetical protein